ncbi:MAG: AAA family ATPase, partial [Acidobacteria bacterium]|nr:AAA family ATPase [Acidobacteriota bacterium]
MKNALPNSVEHFQQAEQLYYSALELEASARAAYLAAACANNEVLRREVASLLAAHDEAGSFIAGNAIADQARLKAEEPLMEELLMEDQATAMLPNPLSNSEQRAINQYRIISLLGRGGMGEVWRAEDTRLQRQVALKLLPVEFTNEAERLRRFEQEALAISALNHPNIITIHEIGESAAGRFIVMELVAGKTLRELATEAIALDDLLHWGVQLAQALRAAHEAGITHRDIKPDNLMVRSDGYVKVLDFGLARLDDSRHLVAEAHTKSGMLMGTVKYMSPEQARGEKATHATDIFALGLVFYELATGQHPFNGATLLAVLQQITSDAPPAPITLNQHLPVAFDALIQRMLAKRASARPTAAEVERELRVIARQSDAAMERDSKAATLNTHHVPSRPINPIAPIVGRETERQALHAAFQTAQAGRGTLLCVAGEPGIGKTTVVETFLTELAATEAVTIARGRCSERLAGTEAWLPLLEALESLLTRKASLGVGQDLILPYTQRMKQFAPSWYVQVVSLDSADEELTRLRAEAQAVSQERKKRELAAFLAEIARQHPLVLFIDDLHWADVSTIDVVSYLAGKFDALPVLIVTTYRPSDMLLAKHPFLQLKPDLQARGACHELSLEFLTEADIAEYLTLEFPNHRLPAALPPLIHAKTEGSPLFMADLVRYLRDRKVIANTSGSWALEQSLPDLERELPESVRGMIERKIAQLSEDDHKLLTAASVQGYEFDSAVLAQVLKLDAADIEDRLQKLERVHAFVKLTEESEYPTHALTLRYRFVHVLYQNALYAVLPLTRKAALSAAVAQSLETFYGAQAVTIANDLARLWETARQFAPAADYYWQAAEHSSQVFAVPEAEQLARRGLAMIEKLPDDAARQAKELPLQILLANTLIATQGYSAVEVEQAYLRGRALCQSLGEAAESLPVLGGLSLLRSMRGQFQAGREMAEEFLEIARRKNDPAELFGRQMIAFSTYYPGDLLGAIRLYQECAADYEPELHRSLAWVYGDDLGMSNQAYLSMLQWQAGYPEQAFHHLEESHRLAQEVPQANSQAFALYFKAYQYLLRRKPDETLRWAEQTIALCAEHGLPFWMAAATLVRGWALVQQGQPDEGIEELCKGSAAYQAIGTEAGMTILFCILADTYTEAWKTEEGLQAVEQGLAVVKKNHERICEAELWRLKGELLLQTDADAPEAETCYRQAIAIARGQSAKSWELRAATSLARLWQRQGKVAEARQMLADIYGWFTEGFDTTDLQEAKALLDELTALHTPPSALRTHTVGRDKEREELRAAFTAAQAGRGSLLCVAGEPGIGKTTLVEDFLAELAMQGQSIIVRGRCSERLAGTEAYLPLLEALEGLLSQGNARSVVGRVSNPPYNEKMKQLAPVWYVQVASSTASGTAASAQMAQE